MKKFFVNITEYIALTLTAFVLLATIVAMSGFIWLSNHEVRAVPTHIVKILSKFYSNSLISTNINNLTIQLNSDNAILLHGSALITNQNSNEIIAEAKSASITININKLKNFKIPCNITIQNADFQNSFVSGIITKYFTDNSIHFLKLHLFELHSSFVSLGNNTYSLNHELNFQDLPSNITIPCVDKTKKNINIIRKKSTINDQLFDSVDIENIPLNAITHLLPHDYKPQIFNHSSTLVAINILKNNVKPLDLRVTLANTSKDKIVEHISIEATQNYNSVFNLNFIIRLHNQLGHFKGNTRISFVKHLLLRPELKLSLNTELENINLHNLKQLWPGSIETQTKNWLVSSIIKGNMKKASVKLNIQDINNIKENSLDAYLTFSDLTLNYYNEHRAIVNSSGHAHFNLERVKIDIDKANVGNADITNGSVVIKFLHPDIPLIINVAANGHLKNFVHLFNTGTESTLLNRGINIKKTNGIASFKSTIMIPLAQDISFDNSQITAKGQVEDFDFNITDNIKMTSKQLNLLIKDHTVSIVGNAEINGQRSSVSWINNLISKGHFDTQIAINSSVTPDSGLLKLLQNKVVMTKGEMLGTFLYFNKDNVEKIQLQLNMDNAAFTIPDVGLIKSENSDATLNIEIESLNQGNWKSKNTSFISKADNINIKSDIELSNNFNEIRYLLFDIVLPNSNLNISFNRTDTKESLSMRSTALDLENTNLFGIFNTFTKQKKSPPQESAISLQLDNIKMKNGIYFKNILGHFDCKQSICSNSGLSMTMNNNKQLTVKLLNKNGKNVWIIKSNNAAYFLKGLNIYKNIDGGELTVKLTNITAKNSKVPSFSGTFKMKDFSAVKTPLLTKLIILSPFSSLIKTLEGKDLLPFKNMEGHFITRDQSIRIEHAFATGKLLTATIKGNVDYKNDTLNLYGKMIPKSLVNSIFNQQTEQEQGKAVLSTRYRVVGKLSEPEVRVHPLGALLAILTRIPLGIL